MSSNDLKCEIVVFTRDLRVHDNPTLMAACTRADTVVPMFVLDTAILGDAAPHRTAFLAEALTDLDRSLRRRGARLVMRRGRWMDEVMAVAASTNAVSIHVSDDVSMLAKRRLAQLREVAERARVAVELHPGVTVVPPGQLRTRAGAASYQVFTPYLRAWLDAPWRPVLPAPKRVRSLDTVPSGVPELIDSSLAGGTARRTIVGGEQAGRRRLDAFIEHDLEHYDDRRNTLTPDATSRISAYLHFGCLSPAETASRVLSHPGGDSFARQLCWRDFFHQVLAARPESAQADQRETGRRWNVDDDAFESWRTGQTGYPLVDAAMRQLSEEGFIHNRARMIVASFLTKHLYIDWRLGAAHFMSLLVDGDVANNQLNWQWVAGTGTDTNPYRVFNPVLQGRRFDPTGEYVRRYVPELAELDANEIHWPELDRRRRLGYPMPVVDHQQAIRAYRSRLQSAR